MSKSSGSRQLGRNCGAGFAVLLILLLGSAAPTFAATITDRPMTFSFDGSDTSAGRLVKPNKLAVDNSNGDVYVSEGSSGPTWRLNEVVSKFDADGTAANFAATGQSSLLGRPEGNFGANVSIAVDNSGGPTQGRLYVLEGIHHILSVFAPDGSFLWEISGIEINQPERSDVAVDSSGHPWVLGQSTVREYANDGTPPLEINSFGLSGTENEGFGLDVDPAGDVYVAGQAGVYKYVNGVLSSTLDQSGARDIFSSQSSSAGRVFTSHNGTGDFSEYESGTEVASSYGAGVIAVPRGIAYNDALNRVYVANSGLDIVEAFGPPTSGTVPDPAIEATVATSPGTATFHGSVNPQGVSTAYYFEWVEASEAGNSFTNENKRFFRSPESSLPADNSPHSVEFSANNLKGNINWTVRLVVINTATKLRTASNEDTFKPPKATQAPSVTINPVEKTTVLPCETGLTTKEACVSGTVDPNEDSVELTVEWLGGADCSAEIETPGNTKSTTIYIPGGGAATSVPVSYRLTKLTPGEHYCGRFSARNSFGNSAPSKTEQFDTIPEPPSEISTTFVGPRGETSVRLNGRVNPEGKAEFTYSFEWSTDGVTWTGLPVRQLSFDVHEPILVSEQLTGLTPETRYYYRLGPVENETGAASEVGAVKTFTTRSAAETTIPPNAFGKEGELGIELVNSPEKGNQNVFFSSFSTGPVAEVPFLAPGGSRARWSVSAGAPGSANGVSSQFLAERTPGGWLSQSLAPPAAQQFGGGARVYNVVAASPDQSHFVADLRAPGLSATPDSTLVRLDIGQHEETLGTFDWPVGAEGIAGVDMTDDGAHVVTVDPETEQLVDIGGGTAETVSLMPAINTPSECGLVSSGHELFASFVGGTQWRNGYHMMATTDANLVYFRAKPDGECAKPWGLYVRDRSTDVTTLIDPGVSSQNVEFIRAAPDGRQAYFLTASQLDEANDHNASVDLYRWEQASMKSTCLTCVVQNASIAGAEGGGVTPVVMSADFSHAYFVSRRRLVPHEGVVGAENLYVLSGGSIRFVATVSQLELITEALSRGNAVLSGDGGSLIFTSSEGGSPRLTTDSIDCGNCAQLYRYEDHEGSVECLSCATSGSTTAALGAGGGVGLRGVFDMSGDGSTVGFVTPQPLDPLDVNSSADVYQWRKGIRRLITEGTGEAQGGVAAPGVRGIDSDGSNMLFSVVEPGLTGFESDGLANLYDARIGGGFEPPSPPVHCVEDDCQGPLVPPPPAAGAASAIGGRGNGVASARCGHKRGKVRKRCLSRHKSTGRRKGHSHKPRAHGNTGRNR